MSNVRRSSPGMSGQSAKPPVRTLRLRPPEKGVL